MRKGKGVAFLVAGLLLAAAAAGMKLPALDTMKSVSGAIDPLVIANKMNGGKIEFILPPLPGSKNTPTPPYPGSVIDGEWRQWTFTPENTPTNRPTLTLLPTLTSRPAKTLLPTLSPLPTLTPKAQE